MNKFRWFLGLTILLIGFACTPGGDDDDDTTATAGQATATGSVAGSDGLVLLGSIYQTGGSPSAPLALICASLSGDPATVDAVFSEPEGTGNPCDLLGPMTLDPDTYPVFFGTYTPGSMTPTECAETTVTIDGDVNVTVPALSAGACP